MKPTPDISKLPKWAQNLIHDTRREAALATALRWTDGAARDVDIPTECEALSKGWDYNSHLMGPSVNKACSSSLYHGSGWEKATYQDPRRLFSTRLLALQALRHELELSAAQILGGIDLQIEAEKTREKP